MDRDKNATANILWAGTSERRPECLKRSYLDSSSEDARGGGGGSGGGAANDTSLNLMSKSKSAEAPQNVGKSKSASEGLSDKQIIPQLVLWGILSDPLPANAGVCIAEASKQLQQLKG